jgi:hypothetical protein
MGIDPDTTQGLDDPERHEVRPIYRETAERFGYTSLVGLQERERSLRSAASRTADEAERARRTTLADEAETEIERAQARGQVAVIRRRAANAVSDPLAWFLYAVVIGGLIVFAAGTDKVASERVDPVAEAKSCGDARKAGATPEELRRTGVCDAQVEDPPDQPTPPSSAEARPVAGSVEPPG